MAVSVRSNPKYIGVEARGKAEQVNAYIPQLKWIEVS